MYVIVSTYSSLGCVNWIVPIATCEQGETTCPYSCLIYTWPKRKVMLQARGMWQKWSRSRNDGVNTCRILLYFVGAEEGPGVKIVNTVSGAGARVEFSVYRSRIIASNLKVLWQANCKIDVMAFFSWLFFWFGYWTIQCRLLRMREGGRNTDNGTVSVLLRVSVRLGKTW